MSGLPERGGLSRQRVGETRWTNLETKEILTSLPRPIQLSQGKQTPPKSWGVAKDLTNEEDESDPPRIQIGLPSDTPKSAQGSRKCSFFLRFPAEVRNMIYDLLGTDQYIMINYRPHEHCWRQQDNIRYKQYTRGGIIYQKQVPVTRLWLVSRQLYHETKDFGLTDWSRNTFAFKSLSVAMKFTSSASSQQRLAIQTICLHQPEPDSIFDFPWKMLEGLQYVKLCSRMAGFNLEMSDYDLLAENISNISTSTEYGGPRKLKCENFLLDKKDREFLEQCSLTHTLNIQNYRVGADEEDLYLKNPWWTGDNYTGIWVSRGRN